jgi:hypothetical protein
VAKCGRATRPAAVALGQRCWLFVAALQGDLEQAVHYGTRALSGPRKSLPSLLMVSRDLTRVLNDQYQDEPETQAYLDQLHALISVTASWFTQAR